MIQANRKNKQKRQPTIELLELFPYQGEWTESDYFKLPETNRIIELSEGRLIITPSPTDQHQKIAGKLFFLIYNYLLEKNIGDVRFAPLDVRLGKDNIRQPDIVFMSNEHRERITESFWGVPDLVMEVLSDSTAEEERVNKFFEYLRAGVLEYWIVDPYKQTIEVFTLENGTYELFGKWNVGETAKSKLLKGFEVNIDKVLF